MRTGLEYRLQRPTQAEVNPLGVRCHHSNDREWARSFRSAAITGAILLLSACAGNDPVTPVDTACDRFAHISFTDQQIAAVKADWTLWESAADQIVAHNIEFDKRCLGLPPVKRT